MVHRIAHHKELYHCSKFRSNRLAHSKVIGYLLEKGKKNCFVDLTTVRWDKYFKKGMSVRNCSNSSKSKWFAAVFREFQCCQFEFCWVGNTATRENAIHQIKGLCSRCTENVIRTGEVVQNLYWKRARYVQILVS